MVAQTRTGGQTSGPRRLKFSEKLVGKGLSTDALLKKIRSLHSELAELDQENVDTKSLTPVCKELISSSILLHKDQGVKAYAACCLSDLLRLFAPDAPFTGPELRDIFQFFFRQLTIGLKGSDSLYYNEYFHLLESLSTVKSVVLVCDLPQSDELMTQIFRDFFALVRQQLAKNVEMFMSEILSTLIEECQHVPSEVLETIMAQYMDKNARMDQPAYRLAVEVCNATADKLQRNVCQYFTDHIVHHAQAESYDEVARCHALIKRLNVACPALLHNVVPQLEEELRVEQVELRVLATQVLGEMFADKVGGDLEKKYPSTWSLYLSRKNDKATQVRLAFIESCKGLLLHPRADLRESVEKALEVKLLDPDERVRAAVCRLYGQLDYETALHHVTENQLRAVGGRTLDKKHIVRQEALKSLGRLFCIAYPEIENNDLSAVNQFAWIPQQILHTLSATFEAKQLALQVFAEHILPVPSKADDDAAWTDRLLNIMQFLDDKGISWLMTISNLKHPRPSQYDRYLQCCIDYNGGIIDQDEEAVKKRLSNAIRLLSSIFYDPHKASEDLQSFAKLNEQRLYKLLKTCMDPRTDLKGLVKASSEFTRRVDQSMPMILPTMMSFFRQASLWIANQSSVPTLIKWLQKSDGRGKGKDTAMAENAQTLLITMSKSCPAVHHAHISELMKAIADEKNPRLVEVCLQALAAVCRDDPSVAPTDKRVTERLMRYVRGSNSRHAKFAARAIAFMKNKEELCSDVVNFVASDISQADLKIVVGELAVLVEMVRFAPEAFEEKSEEIVSFLLKETLLQSTSEDVMEVENESEDWVDKDRLSSLGKAKILALKLFRYRCLIHANTETALDLATPVLKLFVSILENGGSINGDVRDDATVKSRLRLQAAWSLTQLSTVEKYLEAIAPNFMAIALTMQDPCFNVRLIFLTKLMALIATRRVSARFNVIPFLTAHDPEDEIKDKAKTVISYHFRKAPSDIKLSHWEMIFVRLLHILAHHPDFGMEEEQILDAAKYIRLYLSIIATSDNVSLLYNLAQKCKTVRDPESYGFSENLYALSELSQELIKGYAKNRQWSLPSYPGKVRMPADIFRPLPSDGARSTILKTAYLPEKISKLLDENSASIAKEKSKQERKLTTKRKSSAKSNGSVKRAKRGPTVRRKKKAQFDEDDDDREDVEDMDEEEDDVEKGDESGDGAENSERFSVATSDIAVDVPSESEKSGKEEKERTFKKSSSTGRQTRTTARKSQNLAEARETRLKTRRAKREAAAVDTDD